MHSKIKGQFINKRNKILTVQRSSMSFKIKWDENNPMQCLGHKQNNWRKILGKKLKQNICKDNDRA